MMNLTRGQEPCLVIYTRSLAFRRIGQYRRMRGGNLDYFRGFPITRRLPNMAFLFESCYFCFFYQFITHICNSIKYFLFFHSSTLSFFSLSLSPCLKRYMRPANLFGVVPHSSASLFNESPNQYRRRNNTRSSRERVHSQSLMTSESSFAK